MKIIKRFLIFPVVLCFAAALSSCESAVVAERAFEIFSHGEDLSPIVIENASLSLEFLPKTAEIILTEKETGVVWRSTPEGAADDAGADTLTKEIMQSQFTVSYADASGAGMAMNSYKYSVSKGTYDYNMVNDGIEVKYAVGDIAKEYLVPVALTEERMDEITAGLSSADKKTVTSWYNKRTYSKLRAVDIESMKELYPTILAVMQNEMPDSLVYVLRDKTQNYQKEEYEEFFAEIGYTAEQYTEDMERFDIIITSDKPAFNVVLRYELDGNSLKVTAPFDEIAWKSNYPITQLNILPFFGAGGLDDEGYLFVPDGSGSIINFNNGRQSQVAYNVNVYGWDEAQFRAAVVTDSSAVMPVYGIQRNGAALLAVIEKGSAYAGITADVSGRNCSFNRVSAAFTVLHSANMDISAKSDRAVLVYENSPPEGESIVLRITPCAEEGYVGMAKEYRSYLQAKYPSLVKRADESMPVAVEVISAVRKIGHIAGVPVTRPYKLTSYAETEKIVRELANFGWEGVNLKLTGWFNGGVDHDVPSNVKPIGILGGSSALRSLVNTVNSQNFELYAEGDFMYMRNNNLFDGFSIYGDAARYVNYEIAEIAPYSPVWFGRRRLGGISYLARPAVTLEMIDGFARATKRLGVDGLAFRSVGSALAGDYNEKRLVSREASMNAQSGKLLTLSEKGSRLMISAGNAYAAPYADFIVDMPVTDQYFGITDGSVPFYQITLHGLVPYAGKAVNMAEDYSLHVLQSAESGAGLYFSFMKETPDVLRETKFVNYYAVSYDRWIDGANALYKQFAGDFAGLWNKFIDNHIIIAPGFTAMVYEDGTAVYVNATEIEREYGGVTVAPFGYEVKRGGGVFEN